MNNVLQKLLLVKSVFMLKKENIGNFYREGKLYTTEAIKVLDHDFASYADGGGSNSSSWYLFKLDLQNLSNEIGIEIRMAHYPPYTSKYNPIEHRMFCHVTRACEGVVFKNVEIVKELIEKTHTKLGLKVLVTLKDKIYETGKKVCKDFKENMTIVFDTYLGKGNYCAIPICVLKSNLKLEV